MNVEEQIENYLAGQPEPKRTDMEALHRLTLEVMPGCKLWFSDGKNGDGKTVANPSVGYGAYTIHYADGTKRESFRIGLSANQTGISVYILGLADKTYLPTTIGKSIGKANVTGYCIRFRSMKDIHEDVLRRAISHGAETANDAP